MSNPRKTLPLPPPGRTVGDAIEASLRAPNPPARKTPSPGERRKSIAPRAPRLSSSSSGDLRRSPRPGGRKSIPPPPHPSDPEDLAPPEVRATNWLAHGRALAAALEEALRSGAQSPRLQACVERAYGAWNLDGASSRQISQVAHLTRRAYDAIRSTSRAGLELAYADCARVLHLGFPTAVRRRVALEVVVEAVRTMRREADRWVAVVDATMLFVGWADANRARAAEAIRQALNEHPPDSGSDD
jgi:hypothetical protein